MPTRAKRSGGTTKTVKAQKAAKATPAGGQGKKRAGGRKTAKAEGSAKTKTAKTTPEAAKAEVKAGHEVKTGRKAAEATGATAVKREKPAPATFEPRIVVFACNWCSYAGADTAGVSRLKHSPKFRVIRTMCSGRVNVAHVLRAFQLGADGVLVSGCHIGDCHYLFGNHWAIKQFEVTKNILRMLGLEEGRVRLEWVSAAEGPRWASLIDEFVATIEGLGPSPLRRNSTDESFQTEPVAAGVDE